MMPTGNAILYTPNPNADMLHSLIADAIIAAHLRRRSRQDKQTSDDIPLVYSLLDYLLIALPQNTEVLIAVDDEERTPPLSTASGGPCTDIDTAILKMTGIPFNDNGKGDMLWLADRDPSASHSNSTMKAIARQVAVLAAMRDPELMAQLTARLVRGVKQLTTHLANAPYLEPSYARMNGDIAIDDVIERMVAFFNRELRSTDADYSFVVRYWAPTGPTLLDLKSGSELDANTDMACQVSKVLATGIARWSLVTHANGRATPNGNCKEHAMIVSIPGHFGGVPWLVSSRELPIAVGAEQWWAYTTYRDYSITHTMLRDAAKRSVANEMKWTLLDALERHISPGAFKTAVESKWSALGRIYPISTPLLKDIALREDNRDRLLSVGARHYDVAFSEVPNPYFVWPRLPKAVDNEGYGPFSVADTEAHFIRPLQADLHRRLADKNALVARTAYAVGHPLKHRLNDATGTLNWVGKHLSDGDLGMARDRFDPAFDDVQRCHGIATLMHLLGNVLAYGPRGLDVNDTSAFYVYGTPFDCGEHLARCAKSCEKQREDVQLAPVAWWRGSAGLQIDGDWLTTKRGKARYFDILYVELLYECILNALKHGCKPICRLEVASARAAGASASTQLATMVISNACPDRPLNHRPGVWCPYDFDAGHEGGLRFFADCLRICEAGTIELRQDNVESQWWFRIRLSLEGMSQAEHTERHNVA